MLHSGGDALLFAVQLGQSVDTGRSSFLVLLARSVLWVGAEHIVGADMYQQSVNLLHCLGEIFRSCRV